MHYLSLTVAGSCRFFPELGMTHQGRVAPLGLDTPTRRSAKDGTPDL